MVVAAHPGSSLTIAPELDLVKAALLYGDKVSVLSPVTTMLLRVEALETFSIRQQLELVRRVSSSLLSPEQALDVERSIEEIDGLLRPGPGRPALSERMLGAALAEPFDPVRQELAAVVSSLVHSAGLDQLARARAMGLVSVENADPGDTIDLLVSCVIAAKLAETGRHQDEPHTDRIIDTFVEKLASHLSSGREYLVFDEQIASLVESAIQVGVFQPATGPTGRSAQAMTASALMGRLPSFPNATVDEVLDIRTELQGPLRQFRSAMVTVSKGFTSQAWEKDFQEEVHDAWVQAVHPAIAAIEGSVRDNRSLLSIAAGIAEAAHTSLGPVPRGGVRVVVCDDHLVNP